jgi:hypothetical protein
MRGYFLGGFGKRLVYLGQLAAVLALLELLLHLADVLEEVSLASIENVGHLICMADRGSKMILILENGLQRSIGI